MEATATELRQEIDSVLATIAGRRPVEQPGTLLAGRR
jgi:hypothetical protein